MNAASILLPLIAAVLYVVGALLVKRAGDFGVGVWRTAFVASLVTPALSMLLLPLGGTFHAKLWWQPALLAVLFIFGHLLNYLALQRGDVSVATPVLGVKIILVAFFTTLVLAQHVPAKLWSAALLSSLAIALLNRAEGGRHHHVGSTILFAGISSAIFALFDVLLQKWSPPWGVGRFLPAMMAFVPVLGFGFVPFFHAPLRAVPRAAWPWLLAGCLFIGAQSVVFGIAVVKYGNVTAANILVSSRGLWSVVAVWLVGHWFGNREQHLGARVLRWRLAGAALMMAAIALVLL
ncbi:MAG TPA: DMT family transporter [Verrucomicrobiae bacterium]